MTASNKLEQPQQEATWCPEQQIYINGTIASSSDAQQHIDSILQQISSASSASSSELPTPPPLHIFGYGSLCWNPGSSDEVLANPRVERQVATAIGWKRCWCQKSTDHRGEVSFPGLVCTLLSDEEIRSIHLDQHQQFWNGDGANNDGDGDRNAMEPGGQEEKEKETTHANDPSMTEGVLYTIPHDLVQQCLDELDFREKGGYARDVIQVLLLPEETNNDQVKTATTTAKALLYRGTPDNPAFSKRALLDPIYAAAIMAVAIGPSGRNDEYLYNLDQFLSSTSIADTTTEGGQQSKVIGDRQTQQLAMLSKLFQNQHNLHFLIGAGSNQHDQLLLSHTVKSNNNNDGGDGVGTVIRNGADLINGEDAHSIQDLVLVTPKQNSNDVKYNNQPKSLYAGGAHSGFLSQNNELYLWGLNDSGQLGRESSSSSSSTHENNQHQHQHHHILPPQDEMPSITPPLNLAVSKAALGHDHTLIIDHETRTLYCFGNNSRGQVLGQSSSSSVPSSVWTPTTPLFAVDEQYVDVDAGVFHSAAITSEGELVTFGCGRFGQCLPHDNDDSDVSFNVGRWKPNDGSRLMKVSCGRRHTVVLDEHGRVWAMGDNKYGQLGRPTTSSTGSDSKNDAKKKKRAATRSFPELVHGPLGEKGSGCVDIDSGWSHSIGKLANRRVYAWGRNDRFQVGLNVGEEDDKTPSVSVPRLLNEHIAGKSITQTCCGSESLVFLDEDHQIHSCGWNEHIGQEDDMRELIQFSGVNVSGPKSLGSSTVEVLLAAGGAHFLAGLAFPTSEDTY